MIGPTSACDQPDVTWTIRSPTGVVDEHEAGADHAAPGLGVLHGLAARGVERACARRTGTARQRGYLIGVW
jgi:hypothetical protein